MIGSVQADHLLLEPQEAALVAGFHQLVHERGGRGEARREAPLAGGQPEPQGDMGLARAARAQGDDVLAPLDPLAARQLQHLRLVQRGDGLEVEAVEALGNRELRRLDAPLDHAPFAIDRFQLHQPGQELNTIQALGRALARHFLVFPQEGRQPQGLEVVCQQDVGPVRHAASSDSRHM